METSFISGSENLYKYLVSIGLLLIVLTVFYPLKEKQNLEISRINTEKDAIALNYKIKEIAKQVKALKTKLDSTNSESVTLNLDEYKTLIHENQISQFELERKNEEIITRKKHIKLYNILFWVFFPVGLILTAFGFFKWLRSKTIDDAILNLEKTKLELEIEKLRKE